MRGKNRTGRGLLYLNAEDCQNMKNQNVSAINHANSISSGWCIHFLGDSFLGVSNFGDT